ncbi:type II secretion system major pseudopilin GspG [Cupriavidus agavae]|uniref:Type II secretion system core protein G n=1 Tax=Cupriavidus agavae TaxID=1001822 RepID=A0A4Q7RF61_9BURK|nr:type II secretion system major pseudopilin GspG [Cupriavidus agavae]RZT31267.1 general secretion pathway protein G [Cupriavidus agavae]
MSLPNHIRTTRLRHAGFTLLELLVVLLIIAMLAGYVGPKLFGELDKAKVKTATGQMKALGDALDRYRLDMGAYPATEQGLDALTAQPADAGQRWQGPYLTRAIPADPWGQPYRYAVPGTGGKDYDLSSTGADGKPGGTGHAADIAW